MGTLTILLHPHLLKRSDNSTSHLNMDPKKCPVYFHLPWLGNVSTKFKKQMTTVIQRCYFTIETSVVFTTRPFLPATKKDILPAHHHNNVIYQFVCSCNSRYVGCTVHPKGCKNILSNLFPGRSETIILPKIALIFPVPAKKTALLKSPPMTLLLDSIFWKTLPVPVNIVTPNSLFLSEDVLLSTSPLLKLRFSNLFNQFSVDTKNVFTI